MEKIVFLEGDSPVFQRGNWLFQRGMWNTDPDFVEHFRGRFCIPRGETADFYSKEPVSRGENGKFGLFSEEKRPEKGHMNGEFLKILEGKLRKEILREMGSEGKSTERKVEPSPYFTLENDGMTGFSWLLGTTDVTGPSSEKRARSAYGVKVRTPPPRQPHCFSPSQQSAFDHLTAITGLPGNFSKEELRKAWRCAARLTHPDRGGSADEFREVEKAYRILSELK